MHQRQLNLFDATMMVMGGIIGVGIFYNPAKIAALVPEPTAFLAMWAVGGLVALTGALTFAELGGTFPHAGGWYVFLREGFAGMFGGKGENVVGLRASAERLPAFLFAWVVLFVISTGAIAVMMTICVDNLCSVFPALGAPDGARARTLGALILAAVTGLSMLGVKTSATFQNACMIVKLAAIGAIFVGAWIVYEVPAGAVPAALPPPPEGGLFAGMRASLLPILFACGGWQLLCYVAPRVRDAQRTIPRAIVIGIVGVIVVYVLANAAYLRVLGIGGLAGDSMFAGKVAAQTLGPHGGNVLRLAMAISALGICVVTAFATPWLYVAMAQEGLFFKPFANLHPKTGAPILALSVQLAVCLCYWIYGNAGWLVDSIVFVEWVFHALTAIVLLRLRKVRVDLPRPFRSPLYPLAPIVYLLIALLVLSNVFDVRGYGIPVSLVALGTGLLAYVLIRMFQSRAVAR